MMSPPLAAVRGIGIMYRSGGLRQTRSVPSQTLVGRTFVSGNTQHFSADQIARTPQDSMKVQEGGKPGKLPRKSYWKHVPAWKSVEEKDFLSYRWQVRNTIEKKERLIEFLHHILPSRIIRSAAASADRTCYSTAEEFIRDVEDGLSLAPMAIRLTPHILSLIDWTNPYEDPIRQQFIPTKSRMVTDHPALMLDSLHETEDSPIPGLVHRYPDKVLFLATSVCPVYCRFCTRSYAVGGHTELVTKASQKPTRRRWELVFDHIERHEAIQDVVVSGGDAYYLQPEQLRLIGERLLAIPHIKRIRFATKGLGVCPMRIVDPNDAWTAAFLDLTNQGRRAGKQVAMHTHLNHPREVSWVTALAAQHLFMQGAIVRNQTVLLRGVNDDIGTMASLIRALADLNIQPYYVYQADMVRGVEDLRTPLRTILSMEQHIRGSIAGFMMPAFVVDLPGGGGKRLANSFESYDEASGISTWKAPVVGGDKVFTYHDPL